EPLRHRLLTTLARVAHDPSDRERRRAARPHLDRNLVRRAADAAAAHLESRTDVLHRALERGDRIPTRLPLDVGERVVDDALGHGALAALEHLVDDLGDDDRPVDRVGNEVTTRGRTLPGHARSPFPLPPLTA